MKHIKTFYYAATIILAACSTSTEPREYTLPDRDYSLDPAALVAPELLYVCRDWVTKPPAEAKIFVDVSFGSSIPTTNGDSRPSAANIAAVEKHGGQIIYKFHFSAARAWIETTEIPALYREQGVRAIYGVKNLSRYDWSVFVGYAKPYSHLDGAVRFAELGGRVTNRYDVINSIAGVIPDLSADVLRKQANVGYVESQGWGCLD